MCNKIKETFDKIESISRDNDVTFKFQYVNHGDYWELTIHYNVPFEMNNKIIGKEEVIGKILYEAFVNWSKSISK